MRQIILAALICFGAANVYAQSGQLGSGQVWGNATASAGQASPTNISPLLDRAICGTNGDFLLRVGGTWQCGSIGTGLALSGSALNLQPASAGTIGGVNSITSLAHNWIAYIDTAGLPHQAQPAISDISGWGTNVAAALGNPLNATGGLQGTGTVNSQSTSYTIAATDCSGVVVETGAFQTITLPSSLTGFPTSCPVRIVNGSSTRAQALASFPASLPAGCGGACLWPNQGITVATVSGAWVVVSAPGRWKAPSPGGIQLYASPTGSNNNDCLALAAPCATIQNALNIVQGSIDFAPALANIATINLATGTYSECLQWFGPIVGAEDVTVLGNTGSPASYIISCTGGAAIMARDKSTITFSGVELAAPTSGQSVVSASQFATVDIGNSIIDGNSSGNALLAQEMGTINETSGTITIGTSIANFAAAQNNAQIQISSVTINSGVTVGLYVNVSFGAGVAQAGGTITNNGTVTTTCSISFLGWLNRGGVTYPGSGTCTPTNGGQIN